jgi:hypothetical protein
MRNRILQITRSSIPYVKELQPLAGTVTGCILMQQLDFWFERRPNGFWKFLEPSRHDGYKTGDSWVEELGMSPEEFRTAFDRIGIRYKSKGQYEESPDKFQGKFYCSYLDRRENLTHYFRNHILVDKALDELVSIKEQPVTENGKSQVTGNGESQVTGNRGTQSTQIEKVQLQEMENLNFNNTKITNTEITQIPPLQLPTSNEFCNCSGGESELIFPAKLLVEQKKIILGLIQHLALDTQQKLLDELEGALRAGTIKLTPTSFFRGLVSKEKQGKFTQDLGISVQSDRKKQTNILPKGKLGTAELQLDPLAQQKGEVKLKDPRLKERLKERRLRSVTEAATSAA